MTDGHTAFTGKIPQNYDRYLGPIFFEPYADDLVRRIEVPVTSAALELACGTGILSARLRRNLPADVPLIATDLNQPMLEYASRKVQNARIEWKQADATALPFPDKQFDIVACQFGVMFFPDKERGFHDAYRVLRPGGALLFNVWDQLKRNDFAYTTHKTVGRMFPDNPPTFLEVPYGFYDAQEILAMLKAAGFADVELSLLPLTSRSPSAADAARGVIEGTPLAVAINERDVAAMPWIVTAVAEALAARYGDSPTEGRMQAFVCRAIR